MASRIKGITIEIGGNTVKLQDSLKKVNDKIKTTESELRDVNKLLRFSPGNTQLLTQKQALLAKRVSETEARLKQLNAAQEQMDAQGVDKNSEKYRALEREIIECNSKLKTFKEQQKAFGSVGLQQISALGKKYKELGDRMTSLGRSMTMHVTAPIAAGFGLAVKQASDFDENINKVDVAFGKNSKEVKNWAKTATASFGLSQNSALEMTAQFGDMGTSMGLSRKEAANMSMSLAGLAGDLASFKNIGVDQAMTALNGVFTGETESLKTLGIVMTQTNLDAFALEQGLGKTTKEMSESEKVALRYAYIMDKTKNAQGDYANTSDGTANSIRTLQESIKNLGIVIGQNLLPIITPIIQKFTEVIQKIGEMSPTMQRVVVVVGLLAAAIGPLLTMVGMLTVGVSTLMSNAPAIANMFKLIAANPVVLVIGAIVAGLVLLYNTSEKFRSAVNKAVSQIASAYKNLWTALQPALSQLGSVLLPLIKANLNTLGTVLAKIVPLVTKSITASINGITKIIKAANTLNSAVKSVGSKIYNHIASPFTKAKNTISKVVSSIKSKFNSLKNYKWLKAPHLKVSGGKAPFGIGGKGSKPNISIDWYAKAMKNGMIMNAPTIFGMNGNKLLGGGEAGSETIVGTNSLMNMISKAVASTMNAMSNNVASAIATGMQVGMAGASNGMPSEINVYMFPNGPKAGEWVVNTYDTHKRRVG